MEIFEIYRLELHKAKEKYDFIGNGFLQLVEGQYEGFETCAIDASCVKEIQN